MIIIQQHLKSAKIKKRKEAIDLTPILLLLFLKQKGDPMRYLWILTCVLGLITYANATSYPMKFVNNTAYDVKFYELTTSANQATPQNFSNYIPPGISVKTINNGSSYTFTTKSVTNSIYMVVVQIGQSLIKPLKFNVNSSNSGTLIITSSISNPYIIISIKKGTTVIKSKNYLKQLLL